MTPQALAATANLALYLSMAVLACAMLSYALYVALPRPVVTPLPVPDAAEALVMSGVPATVSGPPGEGIVVETAQQPTPRPWRALAGRWGTTLTWVAMFLLAASQVCRGWSVRRAPVANMFEFATSGVLALLAVFLFWGLRRTLHWLGLFITAPALLTLGLALTVWYIPAAELQPALQSVWIVIHVPVAIMGTVMLSVAFVCTVLFALRATADTASQEPCEVTTEVGVDASAQETSNSTPLPRRWVAPRAVRSIARSLPGAEQLDKLAYSLHVFGFVLWTFTLVAGAIWAQKAWGQYWNWDPKETWTFVIWMIYAAYLHARATTGTTARTALILAALGGIALIINFTLVNMVFPGQHSYSGL